MNHELRYIIYGDDRLSDKMRAITGAGRNADTALQGVTRRSQNFRNQMRGAANEIPMVGSAMRLLTNPAALAVGALGGVTLALNESSKASDVFLGNFRELQNLNLDKSRSEIMELRNDVMDTAFNKGFDVNKTSTGFYDIQSVTGKFGQEVEDIVAKQGEFAKLMRADFNQWISGTGKAMANYGFGAGDLDNFNRSGYATVKVGSITFDELAKVQSDFAGSAAAAKQSYDSANKLLTLFTVRTKSANEAATLTKSAFTDLFKPEVIKSFEKAGVNMFDTVTGKARQVDEIMLDLNKRFMLADGDKAVNDLRNEFKGSEGLIALVSAASDQSGNLLNTLKAFSSAKVEIDKAVTAAIEDPNYLNELIDNKLNTIKAKLGTDLLLPIKIDIKEQQLRVLENIYSMFKDGFFGGNANVISYNDSFKKAKNDISSRFGNIEGMSREGFEANQAAMIAEYQKVKQAKWNWTDKDEEGLRREMTPIARMLHGNTTRTKVENTRKGKKEGALAELDRLIKELPGRYAQQQTNESADKAVKTLADADATTTSTIDTISGGGVRDKHIHINIGKQVESIVINSKNLTEATAEIEQKVLEAMLRVVQGVEQIN